MFPNFDLFFSPFLKVALVFPYSLLFIHFLECKICTVHTSPETWTKSSNIFSEWPFYSKKPFTTLRYAGWLKCEVKISKTIVSFDALVGTWSLNSHLWLWQGTAPIWHQTRLLAETAIHDSAHVWWANIQTQKWGWFLRDASNTSLRWN